MPVVYGVDSSGAPPRCRQGRGDHRAGKPGGGLGDLLAAGGRLAGRPLPARVAGRPEPTWGGHLLHATPNTNYWNANAYPTPSASWGAVERERAAWSAYVTYQPAEAGTGPPVAQTRPSISGSAQAGQTLRGRRGYLGRQKSTATPSSGAAATVAATGCAISTGRPRTATWSQQRRWHHDPRRRQRLERRRVNQQHLRPDRGCAAGPATATFGLTSVGSSSDMPTASYKFGSIYSLSGPGGRSALAGTRAAAAADQRFVPVVYGVDSSGAPAAGLLAKGDGDHRAGKPGGGLGDLLAAGGRPAGRVAICSACWPARAHMGR